MISYHITYQKDNKVYSILCKTIKNARRLVKKYYPDTLSCWRNIDNKKGSSERIFRNRADWEPLDYWNNDIKVKL